MSLQQLQSFVQAAWHHAPRALAIKNTLGTQRAAGFLRNRGVSCEDAVLILARRA